VSVDENKQVSQGKGPLVLEVNAEVAPKASDLTPGGGGGEDGCCL
jgi:hypothetical protein